MTSYQRRSASLQHQQAPTAPLATAVPPLRTACEQAHTHTHITVGFLCGRFCRPRSTRAREDTTGQDSRFAPAWLSLSSYLLQPRHARTRDMRWRLPGLAETPRPRGEQQAHAQCTYRYTTNEIQDRERQKYHFPSWFGRETWDGMRGATMQRITTQRQPASARAAACTWAPACFAIHIYATKAQISDLRILSGSLNRPNPSSPQPHSRIMAKGSTKGKPHKILATMLRRTRPPQGSISPLLPCQCDSTPPIPY